MIDRLRDRVHVKPSLIHGRGLFAARPIDDVTHIGTYKGPRAETDHDHVLWYEEDDGSMVGIAGRNILRYVNHSKTPNAQFCGPELYALQPIPTGDEITADYGKDWN